MASNPKTGEPSWKYRRLVVFGTIGFCFVGVGRLIDATDTELNQTIASGLLYLAGVTILGYTGLATAQDVAAIWTARSGRPYALDMPPTPPTPAGDTVIVQPPTPAGTTVNVQQQPSDPTIPPPGYQTG